MEEKKVRKVAVVGTASSSVNDAPYDDNSWEIWSLGINAGKVKRFTRWFELHTIDVLDAAKCINKQRSDYLKKIGKDLYVGHQCDLFPEATIAPQSPLLRAERMYAFEHTGLSAEIQTRIGEANDAMAKSEDAFMRAVRDKAYTEGMLMTLHDLERRWG